MKSTTHSWHLFPLTAALLLAAALTSLGQDNRGGSGSSTGQGATPGLPSSPVQRSEALRRAKVREMHERFRTEAKAAAEARKAEAAALRTRMVPPTVLKQYDADGNGLLDDREWQKLKRDTDQRRTAIHGAVSPRDTTTNSAAGR